jgi:hypothetical protein
MGMTCACTACAAPADRRIRAHMRQRAANSAREIFPLPLATLPMVLGKVGPCFLLMMLDIWGNLDLLLAWVGNVDTRFGVVVAALRLASFDRPGTSRDLDLSRAQVRTTIARVK